MGTEVVAMDMVVATGTVALQVFQLKFSVASLVEVAAVMEAAVVPIMAAAVVAVHMEAA